MKKFYPKIVVFFFLACLLYLWTNVSIVFGALKERQTSVCVDQYQIRQWQSTIEVAKNFYLDSVGRNQEEIKQAQDEAQYWRDSYLLLKQAGEKLEEPALN